MSDRLERLLRQKFREAGRQYARARDAYREGRDAETSGEPEDPIPATVPRDEDGRLRIVCRREADRRTVVVDADSRPECFEAGHPDCEGCVEDLHDGIVETW
ncbi:hypothetical protein DVK02_07715 [Halobellus sp. Atlit-31R]|nr:hypothetical protein DVK02_07715 [Halobellus sp. Atlit-31R]